MILTTRYQLTRFFLGPCCIYPQITVIVNTIKWIDYTIIIFVYLIAVCLYEDVCSLVLMQLHPALIFNIIFGTH